MSAESAIAIVAAALVLLYLIYTLLRPEKF